MVEWVKSFIQNTDSAFLEEHMEGFRYALKLIDQCMAMNKLGMVGCASIDTDDSPQGYAARQFLRNFFGGFVVAVRSGKMEVVEDADYADYNSGFLVIP